MNRKKLAPFLVAVVFIVIVLAIGFAANMIEKYTPSDKRADLNKYFGFEGDLKEASVLSKTKEDEVSITLNNERLKVRGILADDMVYLPVEFVREQLNNRFYWDSTENVLLYTTPTDLIRAEVGSLEYSVGKNKLDAGYQVVRTEGSKVFVSIEFVKQYTDMKETLAKKPNHMQIDTQFGEKTVMTVKKKTAIRNKGGIKNDILTEVEKQTDLYVVKKFKDWVQVRTADGLIGFVQKKYLQDEKTVKEEGNGYVQPEYTNIKKNKTINMVWHQVTSAEANNQLSGLITNVKGVNTISPTWFSIKDNEGNIKSIASASYVSLAHRCGLEVWALVDNFSKEVSSKEILTCTSRRERLINQLISAAIEFDLDGLNIDFEEISEETGEDFIQFIRELSIKCRLNGIVLSIDNYVPGFTDYYNREEQGKVADYLIIMGYDEHSSVSKTSGSVASIGFVRKGIEDTLKEVPAEKVINAIPFYTRLWKETPKTKEQIDAEDANAEFVPYTLNSEALGMAAVDKVIAANGLTPVWNEEAQQNYIEYVKDNVTYKSWIEDETSIEARLKLMKKYMLAGVAAWKLGLEKSSIWDVILRYTN